MTQDELKILQALPLDVKIEKSKLRIKEWVQVFGQDGVYISTSGGKDSTVLVHLVRSLYPDILAVYIDTGLEWPENKANAKSLPNLEIVKPKKNFRQIIQNYGYPLFTKNVAHIFNGARQSHKKGDYKQEERYIKGIRTSKKTGEDYVYIPLPEYAVEFYNNTDYLISDACCRIMKKEPAERYEKQTGRHPFLGTLAEESKSRLESYLREGCNSFKATRKVSTPLGFWTDNDILEYILRYNLPLSKCYGEIKRDVNGKLYCTDRDQTGCMYCGFGAHREKSPNRFELLKKSNPNIYDYCMRKWEQGGLGMEELLTAAKIPH
jgi:3'-phosphoadenosine 5'-phosphosulfate sulfotransferase (PAPS reductase)/FAD synthetase